MRKVRKLVLFACTACFAVFPTSKLAKEHVRSHPAAPRKPERRKQTQTGAILEAIGSGAATAKDISKKTGIPLERVHSLLSYHRRRGNVKGFTGKVRLARK